MKEKSIVIVTTKIGLVETNTSNTTISLILIRHTKYKHPNRRLNFQHYILIARPGMLQECPVDKHRHRLSKQLIAQLPITLTSISKKLKMCIIFLFLKDERTRM
ncbi:hypothetical protein ACJW30_04G005900 [Castanea mollissima]